MRAHPSTARRNLILILFLLPVAAVVDASTAESAESADSATEQISVPAPPEALPTPSGKTPYQVPRAQSEIAVDGSLDEGAWDNALVVELNYETRPGENIAPPVETEALITYDSESVYVGFRATDPKPDEIRAHLSDRDAAFADDWVGVVFDTFNDERRAVEFFVNPIGVQMDLFNDDVGGNETDSWDAIWKSAGKITETGYVVEIAVPFHQLRFPSSNGSTQVWGFDAVRNYPRGQRHRIASQPMDRDTSCYLCQISKIEGFEGVTPGRNIEIVPTFTSGRADEREDFPAGPLVEGGTDSEVGLTVRWGMTPNLTLNATLNPDFSQVEADSAQLDINNTFALFFPERRPFFLEGADFFDTPMNAVFTRNVADPDWGVKLSGKQGKNAMGVFVAEDTKTNLLFPGSQESDNESFDFATTDTVLRYRRDFGSNSALGVLFTGREGGDYSNLVGGFDGLYRMGESDTLRFQFLNSSSEYPLDIAADFEQPLGNFSDQAYQINYNHDSRNWDFYGRYQDVGENFRADMGFMPRVDYTFLLGGMQRVWWGEEDKDWYTRWSVGSDWDLTEDQSGQLLEREFEVWTSIDGPLQSNLWLDVGKRDRYFDGVTFDQSWVQGWFEIEPNGKFWYGMFARKGDAVDFENTQAAEELLIEPNFRYNFGQHVRTSLNHVYQKLDVEGGTLFTANLSQLRIVYQLNLRTFVRAIFQYTTVDRDPSLFVDEVDAESEDLFTQLLFSYKLNPQTALFLGYSDTREADETISLVQSNRAIFLKLGYAWNL